MLNNIRKLRLNENMSQRTLGDLLGVSRSAIAMWESSKAQPDNDMLIRLSEVFNTSIDYILGRTEDPIDYDDEEVISGILSKVSPEIAQHFGGNPRKIHAFYKAVDDDQNDEINSPASLESFIANRNEQRAPLFALNKRLEDLTPEEQAKVDEYLDFLELQRKKQSPQ